MQITQNVPPSSGPIIWCVAALPRWYLRNLGCYEATCKDGPAAEAVGSELGEVSVVPLPGADLHVPWLPTPVMVAVYDECLRAKDRRMAEIEFLLIANHAEAYAGTLTVMGAGWTDHWRGPYPPGQPPLTHFGIGVGVLVPWTETNRRHHLVMRLEAEDGHVVATVEGDLELGRPPGIPPGSDQRAVMALNVDTQLPGPGGYRIAAELGQNVKSVSFRVHDEQ